MSKVTKVAPTKGVYFKSKEAAEAWAKTTTSWKKVSKKVGRKGSQWRVTK